MYCTCIYTINVYRAMGHISELFVYVLSMSVYTGLWDTSDELFVYVHVHSMSVYTGLWDTSDELFEGLLHTTQHSPSSDLRRLLCNWILQETGIYNNKHRGCGIVSMTHYA